MMMGYWYGGLGWIGVILNLVITAGIMIGLLFLVIWIVRQTKTNTAGWASNHVPSSAVEIVKNRYARGEITRDEYQNLLADLEKR